MVVTDIDAGTATETAELITKNGGKARALGQDVTQEDVSAVVVEDWVSTPTPLGGPGAEGFFQTLQVFGDLIPDLNWEP